MKPAEIKNHKSSNDPLVQVSVEKQLLAGIREGHYCICTSKTRPTIVSPLAAIPKADSNDVRLIHDCSVPRGLAVNDYCSEQESFCFESVTDALKLVQKGYFMAKVDLKSAYRSVPIHPSNYQAMGLKWKFQNSNSYTYLYDTRLPFGSKKAPGIFHRLTQSVKRMMIKMGFTSVVAYLDDFLIVAPTQTECIMGQKILINLLRNLGFGISWGKVCGPSKRLVFLGVEIDSSLLRVSLPKAKLYDFKLLLQSFATRKRASLRQLQSLAGKLSWASLVVTGGKVFLRRILNEIALIKKQNHTRILSKEIFKDISWWLAYLNRFNGKQYFKPKPTYVHVYLDASKKASGIFYNKDWQYLLWEADWPQVARLHINYKEVLSVLAAAKRWGHEWKGHTVMVHTDSMCALGMLNKGTSRNTLVMHYLRQLFWLSTKFNFQIKPIHVPGHLHNLPDAISRLHQPGQITRLASLLFPAASPQEAVINLLCNWHKHMSKQALLSLSPQVDHLPPWLHNWIRK